MKILPDYLNEYFPYIEEVIEELRMSVMDHAYEMLNCLDIDELTSDDIRHKLELYDIKVENMTESWLPNGRFYRMYPSMRHHRTRLNAIQSIVKSGGQFEGVWSTTFSEKQEYNYKSIQLLRHYMLGIPYDGYFYISGDTNLSSQGTAASSTIKALTSDILLAQGLPAGYTYLYIPWPRPHYPSDSGNFYNSHSLLYDRLYFQYESDDYLSNINDFIANYDRYLPASMFYKDITGMNAPYWFDYHFADNKYFEKDLFVTSTETKIYFFKNEDGTEYEKYKIDLSFSAGSTINTIYDKYNSDWRELISDSDINAAIQDIRENAIKCVIHSPSELGSSALTFPTKYYYHEIAKTTPPYNAGIDNNENTSFVTYVFNENTGEYYEEFVPFENEKKEDKVGNFGTYRYDLLENIAYHITDMQSHIKNYKPMWSEASPVFLLMQSNFNSGLHPENIANNSFYNLFKFKQDNNIISPYYSEYGDNVIKNNVPAISDITHTSCDKYSIAHLTTDTIAYTRGDAYQGEINSLSPNAYLNGIYYFSKNNAISYDPNKTYEICSIVTLNGNDLISYNNNDYNSFPILGMDVSNDKLCIDVNGFYETYDAAYIYFKEKETIETHKFWFEYNHTDVLLQSDDLYIYHEDIENWRIEYSYSNYKSIEVEILGIYNSNDELVGYTNNANIELVDYYGSSYAWLSSKFGTVAQGVCANLIYNLNSEWEQLTWSNVNDGGGTAESTILSEVNSTHYVFRSFSNWHIDGSEASMFIDVTAIADCELTFKINNDSESTGNEPPYYSPWDYTQVFLDGNLVSNYQLESTWVDCIIQITAGPHTIKVTYRKDSSQYAGNDRGYIAIPNSLIDIGTMSGECYGEVFSPVTAAYAICKLKKVNTPAREVQ